MTIVILVLELEIVFHYDTCFLSTGTVQVTMVLFKLELKWDSDLGPFW